MADEHARVMREDGSVETVRRPSWVVFILAPAQRSVLLWCLPGSRQVTAPARTLQDDIS